MLLTPEQHSTLKAVCKKHKKLTPDAWIDEVTEITRSWPSDLKTEVLTRAILICSK